MSAPVVPRYPGAASLKPGAVTLIVRDLDRVARFYEETIGLRRMASERNTAHLGDGVVVLLVLHRRDAEPEPSGFAGLFHAAFLLPTRRDLGRWVRRAMKAGVLFDGASDHKVSEALYLADPEGNGIEIYADRPRDSWHWANGKVLMATNPLDVQGLIAAAGADTTDAAHVPAGTVVGHVHLRVGGLPDAEAFYGGALGLDVTCRYPGATFYAAGGYHHHVATNVWRSRCAPRRSGSTAGLAAFEMVAEDGATFAATAERLLAAGGRRTGDAVEAADPWGNVVRLSRA